MKRRILLVAALIVLAAMPLLALPAEDVNAENLVSILTGNGYEAWIDDDGDVMFRDQYDLKYWIIIDPSSHRMLLQSGWSGGDLTNQRAVQMMNECNNEFIMLRCYHRTFSGGLIIEYCFQYSDAGLDEKAFILAVEGFLDEADTFTDYLIAEGI